MHCSWILPEVAWPADGNHPFMPAGHAARCTVVQRFIVTMPHHVFCVNNFLLFCKYASVIYNHKLLGSCWGRRSEYEYSALVLSFFPSMVVTRVRLRGVRVDVRRRAATHGGEHFVDVLLLVVLVVLVLVDDVGDPVGRGALVGPREAVGGAGETSDEAQHLADEGEDELDPDEDPLDRPVELGLETRVLACVSQRQHAVTAVVDCEPDHDGQDESDVAPRGDVADDRQRTERRVEVHRERCERQADDRHDQHDEPRRPPDEAPAFVGERPTPPVERT